MNWKSIRLVLVGAEFFVTEGQVLHKVAVDRERLVHS